MEKKNFQEKYDVLIVGCGFTGATVAYQAAKNGKRVCILERRNHIAGNMYDYRHETGILVQKYGPHSMHTNNERVYEFLSEIGEWESYILKARVMIDGTCTPSPFNFKTIDQFYSPDEANRLKEALHECYGSRKKVTVVELLKCENELVRAYAEFLFEKDYRPYTAKQWGIAPEEIDVSVLQRVPVRLDDTDSYFDDKYQMMPIGGFTKLFENMLNHKNIDIMLNSDALDYLTVDGEKLLIEDDSAEIPVVYTGALDELFHNICGSLPYRSLKFDWQTHDVDSFQETSGVAYPMADGFTRITEYKKIPVQDVPGKTVVAIEYPVEYRVNQNEPYYPILTDASMRLYEIYKNKVEQIPNLYVCGRLGDFKYYNMDDAIDKALDVYEQIR